MVLSGRWNDDFDLQDAIAPPQIRRIICRVLALHEVSSRLPPLKKRELAGKKLTTECSSAFSLEAHQHPEPFTAPFKEERSDPGHSQAHWGVSDPPGLGEDVMVDARQLATSPLPIALKRVDPPTGHWAGTPVRVHWRETRYLCWLSSLAVRGRWEKRTNWSPILAEFVRWGGISTASLKSVFEHIETR